MFQSFSILFLIAGSLSYINYRWIKLPNTIGLMILGFVSALLILLSKPILPEFYQFFCGLVQDADFKSLLLDGMLSFLLFAGALHVNIQDLAKEKVPVILFSSLGVLISTALVGAFIYGASSWMGFELPFVHCLLFGALISPTDPIAVIAILKKAGVSKSLEMKIEGESLFNDGVGVVVFSGILLLLGTGHHGESESIGTEVALLFLEEAVGGIAFGAAIGFGAYYLIRSIQENAQMVVMLSLATAMGGYSIASMLHFSGPLAMVIAGLIIGNKFNIASNTGPARKMLNEVWEVIDEILNGILFLLIGLVVHLLVLEMSYFLLGIVAIVLVLLARFISVFLPFSLLRHQNGPKLPMVAILTWGGLRGGISLALVLSLPENTSNEVLLFITYSIVLFSIGVQGLTLGKLVKKLNPAK